MSNMPPAIPPPLPTSPPGKASNKGLSITAKVFLAALLVAGGILIWRGPTKPALPPAVPPEKFLLVSTKVKLTEPNIAIFTESSRLEKFWPYSAEERRQNKARSLVNFTSFNDNPDLLLLLNIAGNTNIYTDGKIHAEALNQIVLTSFKIPYKYKDRPAVFDVWADKTNHQKTSQAMEALSGLFNAVLHLILGTPENVPVVDWKKLAKIIKNENNRISQLEFSLSDSTNSEYLLLAPKPLTQSTLDQMHKDLAIQDDYEPWVKRLVDKAVLSKKGDEYFLVIGNISSSIFVE